MHKLNTKISIEKISGSKIATSEDHVVIEEPLEIQLCSSTVDSSAAKSISITMRTPGHDQDLAVGFLFGESIIQNEGDIKSIDLVGETDTKHGLQNIVRVTMEPSVILDMEKLTRHFYKIMVANQIKVNSQSHNQKSLLSQKNYKKSR